MIKGTIREAVEPYQDLVNIYIEDIIEENLGKRVEYRTNIAHLKDFCEFIIKNDLITDIWLPFDCYARIALKELTYLADDPNQETFLLCLYKDYLIVLNGEACAHPIVKLCSRLAKEDPVIYELLLSYLMDENPPAFVQKASLAVFIHPRYIGSEYINIAGVTDTQFQREVFDPHEIMPPHWSDFLRRFTADLLLEDLEKNPGATTLTSYFVENAFFTCDKKLNPLYYYLINKWVESGHAEYVKIFLRNAGFFDWKTFTTYPSEEIRVIHQFYSTCMFENGHEQSEIKQIWSKA